MSHTQQPSHGDRLGSNPWTDLQIILRALKDAGPQEANEGLGALPRPETGLVINGVSVPVGWTEAQIGIVQAPAPTPPEGWKFIGVDLHGVEMFSKFLGEIIFAGRVYKMDHAAELTTSKAERELMALLMKGGMPSPDPNHKVIDTDGLENPSVPDGCWHDAKIAVYFDGSYWHVEKFTNEVFKELLEDATKALLTARKDKVAKDIRHRREIQAAGWLVVTVSEQEWKNPDNKTRIVGQIIDAYHERVVSQTSGDPFGAF